MTVLLVLFTFCFFLLVDYLHTNTGEIRSFVPKGTMITTPGFEMLGALAQDGGEPVKEDKTNSNT
jgi:hypothetical protein